MNHATYFHLVLQKVPNAFEKRVEALCFEHGALGVSELLSLSEDTLDQPILMTGDEKNLDVYFYTEPPRSFFNQVFKMIPANQVSGAVEPNKDWMEEWKKGFHSFQLTGRFWIVPSWEVAPAAVEPIYIDPGMVFGTGTHQTTQGCAELLHDILSEKVANSLLDIGTGTGILAMLAAKMGVPHVVGTEIDEESVVTAIGNLNKNQLSKIQIKNKTTGELDSNYDIVVANIIDGVLLDIHDDIARLVVPGGRVILSGILVERDDSFISQFLSRKLWKVLRRNTQDEWVSYLLERL